MPSQIERESVAFSDLPNYNYALTSAQDDFLAVLLSEIGRVQQKRNGKKWDGFEEVGIEGIEYRPYCWSEDEEDDDRPNFKFEDVEIYWYKHPGRSNSANQLLSDDEWSAWFTRCLLLIQASETKNNVA